MIWGKWRFNLLLDSLQEPEVQVVLVAIKEALVVGEDQASGVVAPVDDICQLNKVLVSTLGLVARADTYVHLPGPEPTAALIQAVVNLEKTPNVFNRKIMWLVPC